MAGVKGVRYFDLFWETLEPHRRQPYYAQMRAKMAEFIERKAQSMAPVSARDNAFSPDGGLKGYWHFAIQRNPDVVIFYAISEGYLDLAMVGSHHDYGHAGNQRAASGRTMRKLANAITGTHRLVPEWKTYRWSSPEDVTQDPLLHELHPGALDNLIDEIAHEMATGEKFIRNHGIRLEDAKEKDFDAYLSALDAAHDAAMSARAHFGAARRYVRDQARPMAASF